MKIPPDVLKRHQELQETLRLMKGNRRPEHTPLFRDYLVSTLAGSAGDMVARRYRTNHRIIAGESQRDHLARLTHGRDQVVKARLQHSDTKFYFATGMFCDLIAATNTPNVTDLSVLRSIGNQTAFVLYERNVGTAIPDDDLVAVVLHLSNDANMEDGKPRLFGSVIHVDGSTSTFMYPFVETYPDLATVDWEAGINERSGDLSVEEQMVSNTFGLLAHERLFAKIDWDHYPKTARAHAKAARRKLPPVNVVNLAAGVHSDLKDHQDATQAQREGWWPVQGHFRLQPYGTKRQLRRQIYIAPHAKGNMEGPNIGRVQVYRSA